MKMNIKQMNTATINNRQGLGKKRYKLFVKFFLLEDLTLELRFPKGIVCHVLYCETIVYRFVEINNTLCRQIIQKIA